MSMYIGVEDVDMVSFYLILIAPLCYPRTR